MSEDNEGEEREDNEDKIAENIVEGNMDEISKGRETWDGKNEEAKHWVVSCYQQVVYSAENGGEEKVDVEERDDKVKGDVGRSDVERDDEGRSNEEEAILLGSPFEREEGNKDLGNESFFNTTSSIC